MTSQHEDGALGDRRQRARDGAVPSKEAAPRRASRRGRPTADFSARDQIVRGAAEVFGRVGYAGASVEDILLAADVSRRTFYKSFRSKEDLFDAVSANAVALLPRFVRAAADAAPTPAAKLEAGVDAYLGAILQFGPLARAILLEQFPSGSKFARRREAVTERIIADMLEDSHDSGEPPVDPLLVQGLLAAAEHIAVRLASESAAALDIPRARRVLLRMLGATLARPGEPVPPLPLVSRVEPPGTVRRTTRRRG